MPKTTKHFSFWKDCNDLIDKAVTRLNGVIDTLDNRTQFDESAELRLVRHDLQQAKDKNIQSMAAYLNKE